MTVFKFYSGIQTLESFADRICIVLCCHTVRICCAIPRTVLLRSLHNVVASECTELEMSMDVRNTEHRTKRPVKRAVDQYATVPSCHSHSIRGRGGEGCNRMTLYQGGDDGCSRVQCKQNALAFSCGKTWGPSLMHVAAGAPSRPMQAGGALSNMTSASGSL